MKRMLYLFCTVLMISSGMIMKGQTFFVHQTDTLNTFFNWSLFDNPFTNEAPDETVFVTHNANPGGSEDIIFQDHTLGVWYNVDKWSVFNEDGFTLDTSISYNALVPSESDTAFVHIADTDNTTGNWTYLDHPMLNGNPNAIIIITQSYEPNWIYQSDPVGIWYDEILTSGRWSVFTQSGNDIPQNAAFNILIADTSNYNVFVHTATPSNKIDYRTLIDDPGLNNNPDAIVLVTQLWNPGGLGGVDNNHEVGVEYVSAADKWAIINEDMSEIPDSASFNVVYKKEPAPEPEPEPVSISNVQQENNTTNLRIYAVPDANNLNIEFTLTKSESVLLEVYSSDGQLLKTIANENFSEGEHRLSLNNLQLKSGFYIMALRTKDGLSTKPFPVIK